MVRAFFVQSNFRLLLVCEMIDDYIGQTIGQKSFC